jgi:hypothetical protein
MIIVAVLQSIVAMRATRRQPLAQVQAQIESLLRTEGPILTLADAARQTDMPLATLADAVRNKRLDSLSVLGRSFVRLADVKRYLSRTQPLQSGSRWVDSVRAVAALGDGAAAPSDLSVTYRQRLYARRKPA